MAQHYAEPPSPRPYLPSDADPLTDGLLAGFRLRPPPPAGAEVEVVRT
jgi:hypothetical protein